jgi:hypothetical protein
MVKGTLEALGCSAQTTQVGKKEKRQAKCG